MIHSQSQSLKVKRRNSRMVVKSNRAVQGHRHRSQRQFTRFGTTLSVTYNRPSITGEPPVANAFRCTVITPGQQVLDQDLSLIHI